MAVLSLSDIDKTVDKRVCNLLDSEARISQFCHLVLLTMDKKKNDKTVDKRVCHLLDSEARISRSCHLVLLTMDQKKTTKQWIKGFVICSTQRPEFRGVAT